MPPFASDWSFFLDVDGTLLDYADNPASVRIDRSLQDLVGGLMHVSDGATAFISGRSIGDLDRLFAPLLLPATGQHGAERRKTDGTWHQCSHPCERFAEAAAKVHAFAAAHAGIVSESKGLSLALHYRLAPLLRASTERHMRQVARDLGPTYELLRGHFVFEIKPYAHDKGTAIAAFLREEPFRDRVPVFIGDDLTDEYGFSVVNRAGGHSIKVGPGPTRARWRMKDCGQVREWLGAYVAHRGGAGGHSCDDAQTATSTVPRHVARPTAIQE